MNLLVAGLVLFVTIHLIPSIPPLRSALVAYLGAKTYRGVFSILVLTSLFMLGFGFSQATFKPVYEPLNWGRQAAIVAVPIALIMFAAANMPTYLRAYLRHPMLLGLLLWAIAHLTANGDLRSVVLFGGLAGFAVLEIIIAMARGKRPTTDKTPRLAMDAVAVVSALVITGLLMHFHTALFGVPVM